MNNNLIWMMQSKSIDQLRAEIDNNKFVDKNLKDFQNGKDVIDNLSEFKNIDANVQYALLLYAVYKMKGGN